jgi:hypothetical protein
LSTKPLPPYVTFRLNFPAGSQQSPSTEEVSPLVEYIEDSIIEQPETHTELPDTDRKWNNFVVNLNGGIKKATVFPDKDVVTSPLPYQVAPSFEKRWPQNGMNGVAPQAFQLTSHKQLEQNNTAENIIEEIMEESDESPPYLPAPSAPSPSQDFVEKSV